MIKYHPWAREILHHDEIQWCWRPIEPWQTHLIVEQCQKYKKALLKWIGGFTLPELMIVVAIISILAAIAVPNLSRALRKSQEASTQANLKILRDAITRYVADHDGKFPATIQDLVAESYINKIPIAYTPSHHTSSNSILSGSITGRPVCMSAWYYFTTYEDNRYGELIVNCNHKTLQNKNWDSY